jgi:hypothetical protein
MATGDWLHFGGVTSDDRHVMVAAACNTAFSVDKGNGTISELHTGEKLGGYGEFDGILTNYGVTNDIMDFDFNFQDNVKDVIITVRGQWGTSMISSPIQVSAGPIGLTPYINPTQTQDSFRVTLRATNRPEDGQ